MPASLGDSRLGYLATHPDWQRVSVPKCPTNPKIHTLAPRTLYAGVYAVQAAAVSQRDLADPCQLANLCLRTAQVPEDSQRGFAELMAQLWNRTHALEDGDDNNRMIGTSNHPIAGQC